MARAALVGISAYFVVSAAGDPQPSVRPDSRMIYVSSSTGDDANDGRSPASPKKTLEGAVGSLRNGHPDWLFMRRGDEWDQGFGPFTFSGRSETEPIVITAYGPGDEQPRVFPDNPLDARPDEPNTKWFGVDFPAVSADDDAPVLIPGDGWGGPTAQPPAVGRQGDPGYEKPAIARWDVVPLQDFEGRFEIGVVAFHMNGIDRVDFSVDDGPWTSVFEPTQNPRTGVEEYWVTLDAEAFDEDGGVEVRAIVYPENTGTPMVLAGPMESNLQWGQYSAFLFSNAHGTLEHRDVYVAASGDDTTGDGTAANPFQTLKQACEVALAEPLPHSARFVISEPGTYTFDRPRYPLYRRDIDGWLTVEAAEGIDREDVVITRPERGRLSPDVGALCWRGVSFDFSKLNPLQVERSAWFDDCVFTDPNGWDATYSGASSHPIRNTDGQLNFATNTHTEDMLYGMPGFELIRDCSLHRIAGDALQSSKLVISTTVDTIDGSVSGHHTDFYQMFGELNNIILYNVHASNLIDTQGFFLEPTYHSTAGNPQYTFSNAAFVNVQVDHDPNGFNSAPYSQMISRFSHVLFTNVSMPNQRFIFRDDVSSNQSWYAEDVVFTNCMLHPATVQDNAFPNSPPVGVKFVGVVPPPGGLPQ